MPYNPTKRSKAEYKQKMADNNYERELKGWQCPLCKTVYSPEVKECTKDHLFDDADEEDLDLMSDLVKPSENIHINPTGEGLEIKN